MLKPSDLQETQGPHRSDSFLRLCCLWTHFCFADGRVNLFCTRFIRPPCSLSFRFGFAQRGGFPGNFQTRGLRVLSAWCLYCTFFKTFQQDAEGRLRIIETLICTFRGRFMSVSLCDFAAWFAGPARSAPHDSQTSRAAP